METSLGMLATARMLAAVEASSSVALQAALPMSLFLKIYLRIKI
jgi:hypothetical protein